MDIRNTPTGRAPSEEGEQHRAEIRAIIRRFHEGGNPAPTLEELAAEAGLAKSTVRYHLHYMEQRGTLKIGQLRRELILVDSDEETPYDAG